MSFLGHVARVEGEQQIYQPLIVCALKQKIGYNNEKKGENFLFKNFLKKLLASF